MIFCHYEGSLMQKTDQTYTVRELALKLKLARAHHTINAVDRDDAG